MASRTKMTFVTGHRNRARKDPPRPPRNTDRAVTVTLITEEFKSAGATKLSAVAKLQNCKFPPGARHCRCGISTGVFSEVVTITYMERMKRTGRTAPDHSA